MFKRAITLVILFSIILTSLPANAQTPEPNIELYAQAAVLMDATTGRVLYAKNGDEALAMASTTKIMTAIIALEYGNLSDYVEVSAYAAKMPKVKLNMREGEYYRLEDLLYSLMLESHNDTAVAIAEHVGGSVEGFAKLMNQKASELGLVDTNFITPSGLDAVDQDGNIKHFTTARELAVIMSYCILNSPKKEEFLKITGSPNYQFSNYRKITSVIAGEYDDNITIENPDGEGGNIVYEAGSRNFSADNHNAFLHMMEGAFSGKTGFTAKAGYCYVGSLEQDGRVYVVALLACGWPNNKSYKWSDTRKLMEYGLENYFYREVFTLPEVEALPVLDGIPESGRPDDTAYTTLTVSVGANETEARLLRADEAVTAKVEVPESLTAPIALGEPVGKVSYYLNGEVIKEYPIITSVMIEKINYRWAFKYIFELFCI
jgi:D-alanyl-D-alanine carboxypeptidase (penicillin-binding protein 5/6)